MLAFLFSSAEIFCKVGDLGSIPGLGGSPGEWNGYPLQCSDLENSMDCIVHGVTKSQTQLSDFHFHSICQVKQCEWENEYPVFLMSNRQQWEDSWEKIFEFIRE